MNPPEMLDYVLGQLEGPELEHAERALTAEPRLSEKVERLERAVNRLLDDGASYAPPPGLAQRTVAFVAEHRHRRSILEFVPVAVPFRWADVAVAAGILIASLLTLVPAMQRSRDRMNQAGCGLNLQQLGIGLAQYAALHGHYPWAPPGQPNAAAGTFAVTLQEAGMLHDVSTLDCPCNGCDRPTAPLPHLDRLPRMRIEAPEAYRNMLQWDYAYHAGYRRESGQAGPVPASARMSALTPLLADQPDFQGGRILDGNSPNHSGRGQNVLFTDGHVSWHNSRRVSPVDSDLFLNFDSLPGPGLDAQDAALVPSHFPFAGW